MEDWEIKIRNDLAKMFRESVPEGRTDPVLDDDGKDMSHPMYGKTHMKSTKELISKKRKGRNHNPITGKTHNWGHKVSEAKKGKVSWAHTWIVTTPEGKEMTIHNLKKFCRRHNLHQGNFVGWGHTKGYSARRVT